MNLYAHNRYYNTGHIIMADSQTSDYLQSFCEFDFKMPIYFALWVDHCCKLKINKVCTYSVKLCGSL